MIAATGTENELHRFGRKRIGKDGSDPDKKELIFSGKGLGKSLSPKPGIELIAEVTYAVWGFEVIESHVLS